MKGWDQGMFAAIGAARGAALGADECDRALAEAWGLDNAAILDGRFESRVISR